MMNIRTTAAFTLMLLCLMASSVVCLQPIKAQSPQTFYDINPDGSVSPQTTLIQQTGNVYTFTSDAVLTVLTVQKSNIILDGSEHFLNTGIIQINSSNNVTVQNVMISNAGSVAIIIDDSSDVTIANNTITGGVLPFQMIGGILIDNSTSVKVIGNTIKDDMFGILLSKSNDNQIIKNNIIDISNSWNYYSAGIILYNSSKNSIYYNNFINNDHGAEVESNSVNNWDNGKVGNYWSDYQSRYPNATDINNSGVGDMPYVINASNTDRYPLMHQVDISGTEPIPTPTASLNPFSAIGAWIPQLIIAIVIVAGIAVVIFSLLLSRRHRNTANVNQ